MNREPDKIRYRRKRDKEWRDGEINFVWEYDGVDIIDLVSGGSLVPAFGDEWFRAAEEHKS